MAVAYHRLLQQVLSADLLRFTTAGSVDDGKSTLIGRLLYDAKSIYEDHLKSLHKDSRLAGREEIDLALLTDGLKAEREQGITIDVAYRHFSTPKRRFIIADTPGHVQYTRNMVTGASSADLAVILIDAQQGIVTQSKRHGFLSSLLGIRHIVLAVNKMDAVDYRQDVYDNIVSEYTQYCAKLSVNEITAIPVSALKGDNVVEQSAWMPWYTGPTLMSHLENVQVLGDKNFVDFRFPVQYVLRPHADFRGFSGTVASGVVRIGDPVLALPSGVTSRVQRILVHGQDVDYAFPPEAAVICLEDEVDVSRGEMLVHPHNLPWAAQEVEAMLVWMDESQTLELNRPLIIKHTTNTVRGHCTELFYRVDPDTLRRQPAEKLQLNDIGRVTLQLYRPIFCDEYQKNRNTGSFILIDPQTNFTVGAGMVIDRQHKYRAPFAQQGKAMSSPNVTRHTGRVTREARESVLNQRAATLWFTGLSGSGKSSIAHAMEHRLVEEGHIAIVLDGDNIRHGLNGDLGFSAADRAENIRRIAEVAKLMNDAGLIVLVALISPDAADRQRAHEIIGDSFSEVFVDAPLDVCEARDPKQLYKRARAGELPEFTGISSPYHMPENPEVHLRTDQEDIEACVERLLQHLIDRQLINPK